MTVSTTPTDTVADVAGREAERAAVVAWLQADALEYEAGGTYGKVVYASIMEAANRIARGEHLSASNDIKGDTK